MTVDEMLSEVITLLQKEGWVSSRLLKRRFGGSMDFTLYTEVILVQDVPEEGVRAGDVGVVVERQEVAQHETGYSVEFFDMLDNTVAVATVPGSVLRVPTHADRPAVRSESVSA